MKNSNVTSTNTGNSMMLEWQDSRVCLHEHLLTKAEIMTHRRLKTNGIRNANSKAGVIVTALFRRPTTWIAGGISAVAVLLYVFSSIDTPTPNPAAAVDQLREKLLGFGGWAVLISGSLMMLQSVIPPLPSNVITITNGLLFGPLWGALLSWTSMLMGASACFFLSRRIGKPFASRIAGPSLHSAEGFFKRYGVHAVFIIRIVPFVPFDAVSYAAGLLGVPFSRFLLASGLGLIPSVLIYTFVGPIVLANHSWLLPIGLCVTAVLGVLLVRWCQKNWQVRKSSNELA